MNRQTVVLDASLREITHIPVPEDLEGTPLLSRDRETLYYCTKAGVRAWNLETGIRRVIKEAGFAQQSVTGLHLNDTVLQMPRGGQRGQCQHAAAFHGKRADII